MRRIKVAATAALVFGALLVAPHGAEAQCYACDDDFWTTPSCVPQGWTGLGGEICMISGSQCYLFGACYGDDPITSLTIGQDGTLLTASADGRGDSRVDRPVTHAPSPGTERLTSREVLQDRTCKGFVTARLYGDDLRRGLDRRSAVLVI